MLRSHPSSALSLSRPRRAAAPLDVVDAPRSADTRYSSDSWEVKVRSIKDETSTVMYRKGRKRGGFRPQDERSNSQGRKRKKKGGRKTEDIPYNQSTSPTHSLAKQTLDTFVKTIVHTYINPTHTIPYPLSLAFFR
jgi:hypothetical protein